MLEIKGRVNTAICYAKVIEDEAIDQIRRMCDYPMTAGSRIRIMPDVHAQAALKKLHFQGSTDKVYKKIIMFPAGYAQPERRRML